MVFDPSGQSWPDARHLFKFRTARLIQIGPQSGWGVGWPYAERVAIASNCQEAEKENEGDAQRELSRAI
jgi:hypothetical protein